MPCELRVASLSAPRPASLGFLAIVCSGILAAGLGRVLVADRPTFRTPSAVTPPLARLGGDISWVFDPAGPPSSRGCSASRWRFPRARAGAGVSVTFNVTSPGAAGMGQDIPLASPPAGDLQAPVLATLAESPLLRRRRYKENTHVVTSDTFAPCFGATCPASPPYPGDEAGVVQRDCTKLEIHASLSSNVDEVGVGVGLTPD